LTDFRFSTDPQVFLGSCLIELKPGLSFKVNALQGLQFDYLYCLKSNRSFQKTMNECLEFTSLALRSHLYSSSPS